MNPSLIDVLNMTRISALEASTAATDASISGLEAAAAEGATAVELATVDARVMALEALQPAATVAGLFSVSEDQKADALAIIALDVRVDVLELFPPVIGGLLGAVEARVLVLEALPPATVASVTALDVRVDALEAVPPASGSFQAPFGGRNTNGGQSALVAGMPMPQGGGSQWGAAGYEVETVGGAFLPSFVLASECVLGKSIIYRNDVLSAVPAPLVFQLRSVNDGSGPALAELSITPGTRQVVGIGAAAGLQLAAGAYYWRLTGAPSWTFGVNGWVIGATTLVPV